LLKNNLLKTKKEKRNRIKKKTKEKHNSTDRDCGKLPHEQQSTGVDIQETAS
jgi:hypothetical protein